jgi:acyl-CoA thioesterase
MPDTNKIDHYEVLEFLAKLANYKGVAYEIDEIKDGRIVSIKNVKIEKIELNRPI